MPGALIPPAIAALIASDHPHWSTQSIICGNDLDHYRALHVRRLLEDNDRELSALDDDVMHSLTQGALVATDLNAAYDQQLTLGERLADAIADFGGSWRFIISFGIILTAWIAANSLVLLWQPFDPYPFILLNLVLSCLAALQAPIIMMSQHRQEDRDRLRAEHDYRVNLKAELEIRLLHEKLDFALHHQWQRLLAIQEAQTELLIERRATSHG